MEQDSAALSAHPAGQEKIPNAPAPMSLDTEGGRYHVQWDDTAPMTPLGQLVFFAQFLHAGGRWVDFCNEAPFGFTSPNAPSHEDVLGSLLLSILCGHTRYAHVNALRFDTVTPPMLGMGKVVSEDSARRNLKKLDQIGARRLAGQTPARHLGAFALRALDAGYRHNGEAGLWPPGRG